MKLQVSLHQYMIYFLSFFILINLSQIFAQPSGGPYGPVQLTYEVPDIDGNIYYVAPEGKSDASGKSVNNPMNLETAIANVKTGDAIILRGGTYRTGNLILNQGIIIQPYEDEQPVLKGTYVADEWNDLGNGLWTTKWSALFPSEPQSWWRRDHEGKRTPLYRFNNDMVFIDGKYLQAVGWEGEVDQNTYYIDYNNGVVYIGVNPAEHMIEITAFDAALVRTTGEIHGKKPGKKGPVIRGITFTQYAYRALEIEGTSPEGLSDETQHGEEVIGTVLENCTISYCSRVAGYFHGDSLVIRNCKISDTSTEGLYIIASDDILLEKNIIMRNNIEQITGYYPAAVKIFNQCYRATCRDNLVIDHPYSNGIWYDVGNVDGVFVNNWIENIGKKDIEFNTEYPWPGENGFFFEISKGVICAGNVFVNSNHGLFILNSSDAQIYNNTFVNSTACIGRTNRGANPDHFGWHPTTGPAVDERDGHIFVNNLLTGDNEFNKSLLFVWQPPEHCKRVSTQQLKKIDNNVYVRENANAKFPLILWSPAENENCQIKLKSPKELQADYPEFAAHSRYFTDYKGPLFKSALLGNYQVPDTFPGVKSAAKIPSNISRLLGQNKPYIGAFPAYH